MKKYETKENNNNTKSKNFTMINNRLLSRSFSCSILNEAEWKKLLHFTQKSNYGDGTSTYGKKNFDTYMYTSPKKYKDIVGNLETMGFISTRQIAQKLTSTSLLMTPYCDRQIPETYTYNGRQKQTKSSMEKSREHFSQIPNEALDSILKNKSMYVIQTRLLMKIYQYTYLGLFNGVDPNIIYFKEGNLVVSERMLFDLDITENQLKNYIEDLINAGLLSIIRVGLIEVKYGMEVRLVPENTLSSEYIDTGILKPNYIFERMCEYDLN